MEATQNLDKLVDWFSTNSDGVAVALSGGVDSAVLAFAAKKTFKDSALSITANYKTLSFEELSTATRIAKEIDIKHIVIEYDELENSEFVKNDKLRCYHCRKQLGGRLVQEANRIGIDLVVDGTNVDDLKDYRPGIKGMRENGIRSPFIELGINKSDIRAIAQHYNLSIYAKPSNACLASRIPQGTEVSHEKLRRIENSEIAVKRLFDIRQVRVRDHGDIARIEVGTEEISKLFDANKLAIMDSELKQLGFKFVTIDARGYRTGNLVVLD
jgi:uncharacterized protein